MSLSHRQETFEREQEGQMKQLLEGKLAPLTDSLGFVQAPLKAVEETYFHWRKNLPYDVNIRRETMNGTLIDLLPQLEPLGPMKNLFVSTQSNWTAYFDNNLNGADVFSHAAYVANVLGCRAVRLVCCPNSLTSATDSRRGRYGGALFEVTGPDGTPPLMYERTVWATNDGGRWSFGADGTPFPFEETDAYSNRKIKDRLTDEMLERYCAALGIRLFDQTFYGRQAVLFRQGKDLRSISLKQRQYDLGIIDALD